MIVKILNEDAGPSADTLLLKCTCGQQFKLAKEEFTESSRCNYCTGREAEPLDEEQILELHSLFFTTITGYRNVKRYH